jgi:hypothetical protein
MNRLFISEQPSSQDFAHPVKANAFDELMLFAHGDFMDHLGGKRANEKLATQKERSAIAELITSSA